MCGITGIIDFSGKKPKKRLITKMNNLMQERGPDDCGIFISKGIGLGSRRLSILDLSKKARQPMSSKDKKTWLVFNGEIYNFQELRQELKEKYEFKTKSDTEVILNAYLEWGIECIKKFNGMFAFAIWDSRRKKVFIVRDRLGIKPLYYSIFENQLVFGSEIKCILAHPKFKKKVNKSAISSYLSYRYVLGEETLFEGIKKLLPGHYLEIGFNGKISNKQYWDLPIKERKDLGEKVYRKKLVEMLKESIRKRMISDVPYGAFISGGLDSSIVVALMARLDKKKIKTYTIGYKNKKFDETREASLVTKKFRTKNKRIMIKASDFKKNWRFLIKRKDLPLSVPNEIPLYIMAKELKKDITVVLSGEGADELFMGYGRIFRSTDDYKKIKLISMLPRQLRKKLFPSFEKKYHGKKFKNELEHFLFNYTYFPLSEKEFIFNKEMKKAVNKDKKSLTIFKKTFEKCHGQNYKRKISYTFEKIHLPGLLGRLDNATMAASVEGRVPFVDHKLVEFFYSIPTKYKLKWNSTKDQLLSWLATADKVSEERDTTKYLLRKTFIKTLPRKIIKRKKMGFPVPLNEWFGSELKKLVEKKLLSSDSMIKEFFDQKKIQIWIEKNDFNDIAFSKKIWTLLNIEFWMEEYFSEKK